MDQATFEFNIKIIGMEVYDVIELLEKKGFEQQAKEIEEQFKKQIKEM